MLNKLRLNVDIDRERKRFKKDYKKYGEKINIE